MKNIIIVMMLALTLVACGGERIKPDEDAGGGQDAAADGATASGIDGEGGLGGNTLESEKVVSYEENAINDPNNVLSDRVIYFGYDSNSVDEDYLELVKHHGIYLSYNANARVRLEGHADERGTREYNVALAESRAQAVKQLMLYEGAGNNQISIISYGEEKPVAFGRDEESMGLNRRVEIVYE